MTFPAEGISCSCLIAKCPNLDKRSGAFLYLVDRIVAQMFTNDVDGRLKKCDVNPRIGGTAMDPVRTLVPLSKKVKLNNLGVCPCPKV